MRSLKRALLRRRVRPDPAPSRWAWRMQRLLLTPGFRFGLRVGLPVCALLLGVTVFLADPDRRAAITLTVAETRRAIEERPEFMVRLMSIDGATGPLAAQIRTAVPLNFPQSSFDLDLTAIRREVAGLNAIRRARVRIRPGGVLEISVTPRVPAALWRSETGLVLVDETGAHVAQASARADHPDLPLIVGEGAARRVPEALALLRTAGPLSDRVYGLVRMGARRWDLVLDRGQRILLPEYDPTQALERVIALDRAEDVLARDVHRVDLRLSARPTVQMGDAATQFMWDIRKAAAQ